MLVEPTTSLHHAIDTIRQRWGAHALRPLASLPGGSPADALATGFPALDRALGGRGIPQGQIAELWGSPGSGALTAALHIAAGAQQAGRPVMLVETEPARAVDPHHATACGVDLDALFGVVPASPAEGIELVRDLAIRVPGVTVLLDLPLAPLPATSGLDQAARRLHSAVRASAAVVLAVGPPATPPRFTAAALRLSFEHQRWLSTDSAVSHETRVTVLKNWQAAPGQAVTLTLPAGLIASAG